MSLYANLTLDLIILLNLGHKFTKKPFSGSSNPSDLYHNDNYKGSTYSFKGNPYFKERRFQSFMTEEVLPTN